MTTDPQIYDFIVVGAGPAGCSVASKLAQSAKRPSVLLVEAGGDNSDVRLRIESNKWVQFLQPEQGWGYQSLPSNGMNGRVLDLARGKGLGGSSAVNFTVWTEPCRDDLKRMVELTGDGAWAWESAKDKLKNLTTHHWTYPDVDAGQDEYINLAPGTFGTEGPLHIGYTKKMDPENKKLMDTWAASGFAMRRDANDGELGMAVYPSTAYKGTRTTAADLLIKAPENLTVITDSPVHRVLFDGKEAAGIATNDGRIFKASTEVILSSGAMESPKILMHSGIGAASELAKFDIPLQHESANVGKNFQDHLAGMLRWERKPGASPKPEYFRDKQAQKAALREWELFRTGPAASIGCAISLGFFKSDTVLGSKEYAALPEDERKHLSSPTVPTHEVGFAGIDPIYYIAPETAPELATCSVILHNLQSRGAFKLQSADPAVPLAFDVGYLEHPYDRRVAIEAMRETVLVTRTEAFLKDNVACLNEPESTSDADLLKWWQQNGNTSWHMSSTCAMGKDQEKDHAVVDTDCKVFGVQKLRVADMSVFPFLPSSHTQTAAYLVGLIAADKIIAEHELA